LSGVALRLQKPRSRIASRDPATATGAANIGQRAHGKYIPHVLHSDSANRHMRVAAPAETIVSRIGK
jgi:hypothetical protein